MITNAAAPHAVRRSTQLVRSVSGLAWRRVISSISDGADQSHYLPQRQVNCQPPNSKRTQSHGLHARTTNNTNIPQCKVDGELLWQKDWADITSRSTLASRGRRRSSEAKAVAGDRR